MGVDAADINGDGRPDLFVADMLPEREEVLKTSASSESFNLFNNVVFNPPDANISHTTFGQVLSQWNVPRELQMSLKFYY